MLRIRSFSPAIRVLCGSLILGAFALADAAPATGAGAPLLSAYPQSVIDSVAGLRADANVVVEPSLQDILDSIGTGLDATLDLISAEYLPILAGCGSIEILWEYSGFANENAISWYYPGDTSFVQEILPGSASPRDTVLFSILGTDSIALNLFHPPYASWFSESVFNFDGNAHVKLYPAAEPNAYYMFWEDLPWLSDADFNDLVAVLRVPVGIPQLTCSPPEELTFCDTSVLCIYYTATYPGHDSVDVQIVTQATLETRRVAAGVTDSVCFEVFETGEYSVVIFVADDCGFGDTCASGFLVNMNTPPVITVRDTTLFLCDPEPVCVPYVIYDPDGPGYVIVEVIDGPGVLDTTQGKIIVPGKPGLSEVIVRVTDSCGAVGIDTFTVDVTINKPPSISLGNGAPAWQCEPGEFCIDYVTNDPDGPQDHIEELLQAPSGTVLDTLLNTICFTPDTSGTYTVIAQITDSCGAVAADTSLVIVTANDPPQITLGVDTLVNQCAAAEICVGYTVSDPDGLDNLLIEQLAGPGILDTAAQTICFTPDTSGLYTIIVQVTDPCAVSDQDTILVTVNVNKPPIIAFGDDYDVFLCTPEALCLPYLTTDPDGLAGHITELTTGPAGAVLDTVAMQVCFTPTVSGSYTIGVRVTDSCGLTSDDAIVVNVTINAIPSIVLGGGVTQYFQCQPGEICIDYTVSDPDGENGLRELLAFEQGIIDTAANTICFTPDTTGTYTIIAIVVDSCGASSADTLFVQTEANQPPSISFGADTAVSQCLPQPICLTYSVSDPNGLDELVETQILGPGDLDTAVNMICFLPDTSGIYAVAMEVTDPCGELDRDTILISVTINRPPTVDLGADAEFFLCGPEELCFDYTVSDPDGLAGLLESLVSDDGLPDNPGDGGDGLTAGFTGATIDTAANRICFLADSSGTYVIAVRVTDSCGLQDIDTLQITVTLNSPPAIDLGADTVITQCQPAGICLVYTVSDPDGASGLSERLLFGPGTAALIDGSNEICFVPDTSGVYTLIAEVTDSCGASGSDTLLVTVTINNPPSLTLDPDFAIFLCEGDAVCVGYQIADPDGLDGLIESLIDGPGAIDTAANQICFTPASSGVYRIIAQVADSCGSSARDTVTVTVTINSAPEITLGPDTTLLLCNPEPVCLFYQVSDADGTGGLTESVFGAPLGSVFDTSANSICFTPDTSGTYRIIVAVNDSCVAVGVDTILVTIEFNLPPEITLDPNFATFTCTLSEMCIGYAISDPNGFAGLAELLVTGPAGVTIDTSANTVCFTPPSSGTYEVVVRVTDQCGLTAEDTTTITVSNNRNPILEAADDQEVLSCAPGEFCINGAVASDPDGNLDSLWIAEGSGVLDPQTGDICFAGDTSGSYCFTLVAVDSCGAADTATVCATVSLNLTPTIVLGTLSGPLMFDEPTQLCLPFTTNDPNTDQRYDITMIEGLGSYTSTLVRNSASLSHCFWVDTTGCYQFIFDVTDSCGLGARDTAEFCIQVEIPDTVFQICIDTVRAINGEIVNVNVVGVEVMEMGGFDFLICYDQTVLGFAGAFADSTLASWEYFTYRSGSSAGCFTCPGGTIRLIGIADMNNGAAHPPDGAFVPKGNMVSMAFYVTPDRTFIGQCAPISFCYETCGDNSISDRSGDTTYLSYTDAADSCFDGSKFNAIPKINFCDGAVCIVPPEDDRGDLNLNGLPNEVGDVVLYTNFFIYGHSVWDPVNKQSQILASDVNCDGAVLTVADLITQIRILTGDQQPIDCPDPIGPKIVADGGSAQIVVTRDADGISIGVLTEIDLSGVFVALAAPDGDFGAIRWVDEFAGMKQQARVTGAEARVLLLPEDQSAVVPAGHHTLFYIPLPDGADYTITETQAAGFDGAVITTDLIEAGAVVPDDYSLDQNYPNPFNAGTVISFNLPQTSDWELTVFNILGQSVRKFSGSGDLGRISVSWDGRRDDGNPTGTGVYFARLVAGQFKSSRKMLLIK